MKNALVIAALASSLTVVCQAAPVPENLLACSKVEDPAERVKCYDAQIEAMKAAAGSSSSPATGAVQALSTHKSAAAPVAPAGQSNAPVSSSSLVASTKGPTPGTPSAATGAPLPTVAPTPESFGQEQLPRSTRAADSREDESLKSRINALSASGSNEYMISLENGQIWRQLEPNTTSTFFRVGDDVHIEKGALGSYHLWCVSTGAKNWILVRRMR